MTGNEALYNIIYSKAGSMGTTWSCRDWLNGGYAREWWVQYEFFNHTMLVKSIQHHCHDDSIEVQYIRDSEGADVTTVLLDFIGNKPFYERYSYMFAGCPITAVVKHSQLVQVVKV